MFLGGALQVSSIGGNIGGNQGDFNYQAAPSLGYFMSDKLVVGGTVGIRGYKYGDEMVNSFLISPFVRNYFITEERIGLYGGASLPITLIDNESFGVNFSAGITFFATDKIALEARTNLLSILVPFDDNGISYKTGINTSSVGLGFLFFF